MSSQLKCVVSIINNTKHVMLRNNDPVSKKGTYKSKPPNVISSSKSIQFELVETFPKSGTSGLCEYYVSHPNGTSLIQFSYSCPSLSDNKADAIILSGRTNDLEIQMIPNPLPGGGHPNKIEFTIF
ncbi:hypothetical protein [Tenacibaculum sp. MAR_2009_124]|uniref:hypothetical protein n=1 Tax=Tenacibaculum sp. MAR_2009_124 TaxID=1250059 RepID=UPI000B809BD3|nr:hypothetical protein [Tenacibaculum sp. MAR_2009_124]